MFGRVGHLRWSSITDQLSVPLPQAPLWFETSCFPEGLIEWKWKVPLKFEDLWGQVWRSRESSHHLLHQGYIYMFILKFKKIFLKTDCVSEDKRIIHFFDWRNLVSSWFYEGITHWGALTEEHLNPRYPRFWWQDTLEESLPLTGAWGHLSKLWSPALLEKDEMRCSLLVTWWAWKFPCLGSYCAWKDEIFISR